MEIFVMCT